MHLDGQDIFVEVDWMTGHRMEERPRNLVIRALGRHDITLHIDARYAPANQRLACILGNKFPADDGCMGGGGNIGRHDDYVDYNTQAGDFNDLWDFRDNFFATEREDIFHYCLFAHERSSGSTLVGWGAYGSDTFIIYDNVISDQAMVFMHELGHNILGAYIEFSDPAWSGVDPETIRSWYNPNLSHFRTGRYSGYPTGLDLDGDGTNDVYDHNPSSSYVMYYIPEVGSLNYAPATWNAIDLVECFN